MASDEDVPLTRDESQRPTTVGIGKDDFSANSTPQQRFSFLLPRKKV